MTHPRNEDARRTPKDEQRTPPSLYARLDAIYHFDIDVAATKENALSPTYFDKGANALRKNWCIFGAASPVSCFCNPPYSHGLIGEFMYKCYYESILGATVVALISCDVSPKHFNWCMYAAEWIRIKGRVSFNHADGTPIDGSPAFGSLVVVFDASQRKKQRGEIRVSEMDWR